MPRLLAVQVALQQSREHLLKSFMVIFRVIRDNHVIMNDFKMIFRVILKDNYVMFT